MSSRILITGLSSRWGGQLAQALERHRDVEAVIGIDTHDPRHELQRTEFVRVGAQAPLIRRIIAGAAIDTVVDTRLIADPLAAPLRRAHEVNVDGTAALLDACGGPESPVRKLVFKSSAQWYGSAAGDPAFFTEDHQRSRPARSAIEKDVAEAERMLASFAPSNPQITLTVLRLTTEISPELHGSAGALLGMPIVPGMLGFDPRCQFIHQEDVIRVFEHAVRHELPGVYNAAGDGVLALSEVASLLGKPLIPLLPPWGVVFAAAQLRRIGIPLPLETLQELRFGRGLDNRRLKASGYSYLYTSREAVLKLRAHQRLVPLLRSGNQTYRYEREVEEFLRRSPAAQVGREAGAARAVEADGYDQLTDDEVVSLIPSLEADAAVRLRDHEVAGRRRKVVLDALDRRIRALGS